jgi:hypothetical protein
MSDLVEGTGLVAKDGTATGEMARWMKKSARDAAALGAGKATKSQTGTWPVGVIEYPQAKDYLVLINEIRGFTINSVTTKSRTGTCTVTVKIDGVALGGTANSVTTSESTQAHTSANIVPAGGDVTITVSAVSSVEDVSISMSITESLA